jgi:PAS domain S-box-containing protein
MLNPLAADVGERERLQRMFDQAPGFMALVEGRDHHFALANPAFDELVGERELVGKTFAEALPELEGQEFAQLLDTAAITGETLVGRKMALQVARPGQRPEEIFVDVVFQPLSGVGSESPGVFVAGHEVTGDKRNETIREAHNKVLELAVADSPLEETLSALIGIVEATSRTGVLGSILLLDQDGKHLRHGAAPSLPELYCAAIDGGEIGPKAGSCGTAAFTGQPIFVSDIATDPLWEEYSEFALSCGLRACWSTPILTGGGKVLGTFAMYHREPREPTVRDLALVDLVTQTAALVIDRKRAQEALGEIAAVSGRSAT